jgi:hypothetical protein
MYLLSCERQESLLDILQVLLEIGFPKAYNMVATLFHVGVLREVKFDTPFLPLIRIGKSGRVGMPVVPIKLDDEVLGRDESVNAKLASNNMLRKEVDAKTLQQGISNRFGLCHFP